MVSRWFKKRFRLGLLLVAGCGPSAGSSGEGDSETAGTASDLEAEWPGYYFLNLEPEGFGVEDAIGALLFKEDHTVHHRTMRCDGTFDEAQTTSAWRTTSRGTIEIVVQEETPGSQPAGTVIREIFVEELPCGPHTIVYDSGVENQLTPGDFCPENFQPGEGNDPHDYCEFVPCDERAIMCAEEAGDGT